MTEQAAGPRPTQVTVAAGVAAAGSALLVLTLYGSMTGLASAAMRQEIARMLVESGHPWGLTVAGAVRLLHGLTLFTGATAAAAVVLAVYTLFRHRGARVGLTIAAALLLLTVVSGVLGIVVAAATAMLWSRPARDWFAGRVPVARPASAGAAPASRGPEVGPVEPLLSSADDGSGHRPEHPGAPSEQPPSGESGSEQPGSAERPAPDDQPHPAPPPTYGFGTPQVHQAPSYPGPAPYPGTAQGGGYPGQQQPGYPGQQQPAYPPPGGWPPPAYGQSPARGPRGHRPVTVTIAAVLTWLFSGIALAGFLIAIVFLLADRTQVVNAVSTNPRFRGANLSENQLIAYFWVACAVIVLWCAVAMVLAFLTFRGHNWARITLVVSAAVSVLFGF